MFSRFSTAMVRPPAPNFADGLTTADQGAPDVALALRQHAAYCDALVRNGCTLAALPTDARFPDSTFVEDTALLLPERAAMLTRPGAESRAGEVDAIRDSVAQFFDDVSRIEAPGTLDAGDVCDAGRHFFIGISARTNAEGARQLTEWLAQHECTAATVDIRATLGLLHLKSGISALEQRQLIVIDALASHHAFSGYDLLRVPPGEEYAANCVRVNDVLFVADGYPETHALLRAHGYTLEVLDMSEFARMDGGLSCLSLRF